MAKKNCASDCFSCFYNSQCKNREEHERLEHLADLVAERIGLTNYTLRGKKIAYISYFGSHEGFYKVEKDLISGEETRKHLKYAKAPKHFYDESGHPLWNHFRG